MGRPRLWHHLASYFLLATGCASGGSGPDTVPCNGDIDCDRRSVCDVARHECVPMPDAGAPDGGGGDDGGADEGGLCAACEATHDCLELGAECLPTPAGDRRCARPCAEDAPCPDGFTCNDEAFCVPANGDCTCLPADDGAFRPCVVENEAGSCEGIQRCDGATGWLVCQAPEPGPEVCDGQDNDCDGERDEPEELGLATCGQGVCEVSEECVATPDGATIECTPGPPALPRDTECNRLDDDCDGKVDEDFEVFTCGQGVCARDATCDNGVVQCVAGEAQAQFDTTCNAIDEDCSGSNDEDYTGPTCGLGICVRTTSCADGVESCLPGLPDPDDAPEVLFEDTNCDGVDGDASLAIFVDVLTGDDGNPGTMDEPMATIQAGIDTAFVEGKAVYVSEGTYDESVVLAEGVGIYGGYSAGAGWSRAIGNRTEISGGTTAVTGDGIDEVTELQLLTIRSADNLSAGGSSYGLFLTSSSGVVLTNVTIRAGDGGDGTDGARGTDGADGADGDPGVPGCEDSGGFCTSCDRPTGGPGGTSTCGRTGGVGGMPGHECGCGDTGGTAVGGATGGPGGCGCGGGDGTVGNDGAPGTDGTDGAGGASIGTPGAVGYAPSAGASGTNGTDGGGGGGGGGGSGGDADCDSYGSSGGGGGAGGCHGTRGTLGTGAGASFAIYLWGSSITLTRTVLFTGVGGLGGDGGAGGAFGAPGDRGPGGVYGGAAEQDDGGMGAAGGWGGRGGRGGHGGGGGGGPSIGIECAGGSDATLDVDTDITTGAGGTGGASFGHPGANGLEADTNGC